jgi:phage baseplate assembly protein V
MSGIMADGRGDLGDSYRFEELERRVDHLLRIGNVSKIEHEYKSSPRVKVILDGDESDWMRIAALRAGEDQNYWVPEIGEQVMVFAPSGLTPRAIVWGCLNKMDYPALRETADRILIRYKDETEIEYNRETHAYTFTNPNADGMFKSTVTDNSEVLQTADTIKLRIATTFIEVTDGRIVFNVNGTTLTITPDLIAGVAAETTLSGNLNVGGDATAAGTVTGTTAVRTGVGTSLDTHTHIGVETGLGISGPPVPGT